MIEGLPMLIQSEDGKYPDMEEVLSTAQPCLMWEPLSSAIEKQTSPVLVSRFDSNKSRTAQRAASVKVRTLQ